MPSSDTMPMANGGGTHSRRIPRQNDWHLPPPPPPPPQCPQQVLSGKTPIPLALAWSAIVLVAAMGTALLWRTWQIEQGIRDLKYGTWTIEDQREFIRQAGLGGVILPDAVEVVRRRLPGPIHQP